ncbi:metallophosphoesterase family protein [Corynebacterium tapiri]|uniref:Metallophosphoesterase n=1 Tax=Corynebacterium tapiri TaxID=1448266 RepID=A0A5C4U5V5_9CORY|nr:metallophosphoesterase [Corynebacterium tapiri]TNL99262.1 metallophosphoesterase [Corynebacterium tapiri]
MKLWAAADLHANIPANGRRVSELNAPDDWLIVAGDVAERIDDTVRILGDLRQRFARVIWAPGNHELFATEGLAAKEKYQELVTRLREIDVLTPEDPFATFGGVTICPLFTLYDYSFRGAGLSIQEALRQAEDRKQVMTDEFAIAPHVDVRAWCWERLTYSVRRLSQISGPTVLVNHWPLVQEPTLKLRYPNIALWCGTRHTRQWPTRYNAQAVIYGHLHMPGTMVVDGVPHHEVSLGYPREWRDYAWPVEIMEAKDD